MVKKMLIDAAHAEEIRVAVIDANGALEDFDSEVIAKRPLKGNIYLAKVTRVEPSLQAAFVDFGSERHGFLPFSEINPEYYRTTGNERKHPNTDNTEVSDEPIDNEQTDNEEGAEDPLVDNAVSNEKTSTANKPNRYRIQEVIKRKQVMLVQVIKEERGGKGASLTTFLSLPGRYSVLMPNAGHRGGGISKKISDGEDRKRLKQIMTDLEVPEGMSLIVRTAGHGRNKLEIRRDYEYLIKLWEEIRANTLASKAPQLVYAEGDLVKRAIRDIYNKNITEILVEGEECYKQAKAFMKLLMPSNAKKVQPYKDPLNPLFHQYGVEKHIDEMMLPRVELPSGGYLVINMTEALVAIDVNSGKSTKERNIDETALRTNLEAAYEIAKQMRLRDLAGLIVIDFIDMEDTNHIHQVERKFKEAIKDDRARIQTGKISNFGLMELSRQRLRPSLLETHSKICHHCGGTGMVRSIESLSLQILRALENSIEVSENKDLATPKEIIIKVPAEVDLYLLNQKRELIVAMENRLKIKIYICRDHNVITPNYIIEEIDGKVIKNTTEKKNVIFQGNQSNVSVSDADRPKHKNKKSKKSLKKSAIALPNVNVVEVKSLPIEENNLSDQVTKTIDSLQNSTTQSIDNSVVSSSVSESTNAEVALPAAEKPYKKRRSNKRYKNKKNVTEIAAENASESIEQNNISAQDTEKNLVITPELIDKPITETTMENKTAEDGHSNSTEEPKKKKYRPRYYRKNKTPKLPKINAEGSN